MKKSAMSVILALIGTGAFAQTKISEGTITYAAEYSGPAQAQAAISMMPKEITSYFKGDSAVTVQKTTMTNMNMITNAKTDYMRLLLDIPVASKKYSVKFTPADIETMRDKLPEFEATPGTETKEVAAYKAQKYTLKDKKTGQAFDAWFTKDIKVPQNSITMLFDESLGFPLEFTTMQNGLTLKATVKEIKPGSVPAGSFSAAKDFEEITVEQLQSMQGGKR